MLGKIFIVQFLILSPLFAQSFEVLRPSEYSVDRFQEVISTYVDEVPEGNQDAMIFFRAKLTIANRNLEELKKRRQEAITPKLREEAPKVIHIRAAQARADHYRKKLIELERNVVRPKRKK